MSIISLNVLFSNLFCYPNSEYKFYLFFFLFFFKKKKNPLFYNLFFFLNNLPIHLIGIKELFLKTFDIQSITTLDIGYIYFGEDYKRANFLIHLNNEYKESGISFNSELSDNISNLLILLLYNRKKDFIFDFNNKIFFLSIRKIINEFSISSINSKNRFYNKYHKSLIDIEMKKINLYKFLFISLFLYIRLNYCLFKFDILKAIGRDTNFLKNLLKETIIEDKN